MATVDITIQEANSTVGAITAGNDDEVANTTAYQLKVDQLTHSFKDPAIPVNLPTNVASEDQLRNHIIALGLRNEEIRLSGILIDRGVVSASNPRRQTLLDVARSQWAPIVNADGSGGSPDNPNSYLLLTIGNGVEPDNSTKGYRGLITELAFTITGGTPDKWRFNMTFLIVQNEHNF